MNCAHINLIKQTGPMDRGLESTRYRCRECSESLYAKVAGITIQAPETTAPPVAEKEDKMDNRDFKRQEGLYLKFSEPLAEPHTPVIIERVNGDCTVSKFIIARDEAHQLINQLCEFLRVAPVAELGQAGRGITYKPIESNGVVVGYAWWALGVDMGYYGIETAIGKRITETMAVTRGAAPAAALGSGQELREGLTLDDYRNAPSGIGPLAAEWRDKPHRLVYSLCAALAAREGRREMSEPETRLLLDCGQCDKVFEVSRTMAQERNVRCPYCGEKNWTGRIRECQRPGGK